MKALYVQMRDLYLIFQFFKGRCHVNQIMLRKCYQRRLIPLAFVALVLENELQYNGLAARVNSGDDVATSSKKLVNFCLVTPEMTWLICVFVRYDTAKKLAHLVEYLWTYWTDFRIFSPYDSALRADDGSVFYFPIFQGTLPWQPNNVAVIKAN